MSATGIGTPALWVGFIAFILAMLALDLGIFHRKAHAIGIREALIWSIVWISLALMFNAGVYCWFGNERALEFLTGYLIEKALSVDNLFVFLILFSYFAVPAALQHRVLLWGIVGALLMRAGFIMAGAALIQQFSWVIYIFGAFLVFTGIKLLATRESEIHPERNFMIRLFRRIVRCVPDYRGSKFSVSEGGRRYATPLLMVLVAIEATDIVFAVDSIPAVFAITTDPFIVFTSNVFAILGLRALYFLLAGMIGKFRYLKVGLGLVLAFVGAKMLLADWIHFPITLSLGIVACLLGLSVAVSILFPAEQSAAKPSAACILKDSEIDAKDR
jgi:tellurite resistance protein TerC